MKVSPAAALALAMSMTGSLSGAHAAQPGVPWFSTWAAPSSNVVAGTEFAGLTTRQTIHTSLGGSQVRLRISNAYGLVPLVIGGVHIAVPTGPDTINAATDTAFTFGGSATVTIPPGALAVSDAASFIVQSNKNYSVSLYTPAPTGAATAHAFSSHASYFGAGNNLAKAQMPNEVTLIPSVYFISGLDVAGTAANVGLVTIGDSITDGFGSTVGSDTSWPNALSIRMVNQVGNVFAIADAGTSASRLLADQMPGTNPSGLARMDRDVLALPGVGYVILALGINDIGLADTAASPSAADVIAGYKQFVARVHERNITVYGATITPAGGSASYSNSVFEAKRQAINTAIRAGGIFDGVEDFDLAVRNPSAPSQLLPAYDSGDHLHPSSAGYQVMANIISGS